MLGVVLAPRVDRGLALGAGVDDQLGSRPVGYPRAVLVGAHGGAVRASARHGAGVDGLAELRAEVVLELDLLGLAERPVEHGEGVHPGVDPAGGVDLGGLVAQGETGLHVGGRSLRVGSSPVLATTSSW